MHRMDTLGTLYLSATAVARAAGRDRSWGHRMVKQGKLRLRYDLGHGGRDGYAGVSVAEAKRFLLSIGVTPKEE